jgi:hypothetical protein
MYTGLAAGYAVAQLGEAKRYKPEGREIDSRFFIDHLHAPIILKSGSLSLLEPSGAVKTCNEIPLPFTQVFM